MDTYQRAFECHAHATQKKGTAKEGVAFRF
jgi:hypothetical protein